MRTSRAIAAGLTVVAAVVGSGVAISHAAAQHVATIWTGREKLYRALYTLFREISSCAVVRNETQ